MNTVKIYCEINSIGNVNFLRNRYSIEFIYFPYDISITRKMNKSMKPSGITSDTTMITADSTALISDTETSSIFGEILKIIGRGNKADIKHVDNAYKENCKIFITNDRNDIISKKEKLQELTGMNFFHSDDKVAIEQCIKLLSY